MMVQPHTALAIAGVVLFLIGLTNGLLIPFGKSPRMGLSAHLTAVQSGTFLIAVALLWPFVDFAEGWSEPTALALWLSLYALWLALFVAGLTGAGRDLPIAGGEMRASAIWQILSSGLLYASIVVSLGACASLAFWLI